MGFSKVTFAFKTQSGVCLLYSALVGPFAYWPQRDTAVTATGRDVGPSDVKISSLLDSREPYELRLDDGRVLKGRFKYTDVRYDICIAEDRVAVRNRFHFGNRSGAEGLVKDGFVTIFYSLPVQYFLWRKATKFLREDFIPEAEDYVQMEEIAILDLEPSAARIIP